MTGENTPYHHGSHRNLLKSLPIAPGPPPRRIDAIFVPTARPPAYLDGAAQLARSLNCVLVTLHSKKWTSAAKATERLPAEVNLVAIDVADTADLNLPHWRTSRQLTGTVFAARSDLSAKRNLALMLSRMMSWRRILFLDDDITGLDPEGVRAACALLEIHHAVGLHVGGFPDHSVVCHAYQMAGGKQQEFVGGGALTVNLDRCDSFFPEVYNDDWFFLLDENGSLQPTAVAGKVIQQTYDPFRTPDRARAEELGDVLAEGIYWLLDQRRPIIDADQAYWTEFLEKRRHFIENVLKMVQGDGTLQSDDKTRRIEALKGSLGRRAIITPDLCERYLRAWAYDRKQWQRHMRSLPTGLEVSDAIAKLSRPGAQKLTYQLGGEIGWAQAWERLAAHALGVADSLGRTRTQEKPRSTAARAGRV